MLVSGESCQGDFVGYLPQEGDNGVFSRMSFSERC